MAFFRLYDVMKSDNTRRALAHCLSLIELYIFIYKRLINTYS